MSATDVVNLVFAVAGKIIQILEGNKEILKEQQDMIALATTITSSVRGLSAESASNYQAALASMNDSLDHARELLETIAEKFKKKGLFSFYLSPDAELKKLGTCKSKIESCVSVLTMALSAQLNVNAHDEADKKFDATRLMQHSSAKKFWGKHFGSSEHSVPWPRFRDALRVEFKQLPPVLELLNEFNLSLMRHKFGCSASDGGGDEKQHEVQVTAYEFADFTDDYGLLQSLQRLLDPSSTAVEKSIGTRADIMARSLVAEGAVVIDFAEATAVRNAFEQQGAFPLAKFVKCASGVLIEYVDALPLDTVPRILALYQDRDATLRVLFSRSIAVREAAETCDEIIAREVRERERLNAHLRGGPKAGPAAAAAGQGAGSTSAAAQQASEESEDAKAARVRAQLEMLILQEETENKADQALSAKDSSLHRLDNERRVRLAECAREPNPLRRQQLEKQVEDEMRARRAEIEQQFERSQQDIQALLDQQTNAFEKRFPGLVSLFSKSKEARDALLREQFGSVELGESSIDSFLCSAYLKDKALPITGNLYVTDRAIYFYSNFLGFVTCESMRYANMQAMDKVDTFYVLPTGLLFTSQPGEARNGRPATPKRELKFSGFVDRDRAYDLIGHAWQEFNKLKPEKDGEVLLSGKRVYFVRDFFKRKEGYMFKLGGFMKNWKRRYFILSDKTLSYSANDSTQEIIETIPLNQVSRVELDSDHSANGGRENVFFVVTPERRFEISAETEDERDAWISEIEECRAKVQQLFFFGVWCLTENAAENVDWRVLEIDFDMQLIRVLNKGLQMLVLPFAKIASAARDVDHELKFSITTEISNIKYEFFTQCPLARNRVVDIVQRSINKSNRVADQFLAFQQALAKATSRGGGSGSGGGSAIAGAEDPRAILNEFIAKFDAKGDGKLSVDGLMEKIEEESSNIRDELAQECAGRRNLCDGELKYSGKSVFVDRYVILQQSTDNGSCDVLVYRDRSGITPLKVLSMTSVNTLPVSEDTFMIQTRFRTKPFVFRCKSAEDRIRWVQALLGATEFSFNAMVRVQVQQRPEYFRQILGVAPAAPAAAAAATGSAAPRAADDESGGGKNAARASMRPPVGGGAKKGNADDGKTIATLTAQLREKEAEIERLRAEKEIDKEVSAELEEQLKAEIMSRQTIERSLASNKQSFASGLRLFEERLAAAETQTLKSGALLLKHVKSGAPHARFVYLSDDCGSVCWVEEKDKSRRKDVKEIALADVTDIHKGFGTPVFSGKHARDEIADCCFSLVSPDRSLDLQCDDTRTRDFWVNALIRLSSVLRQGVALTTVTPATPFGAVGNLGAANISSPFGFGASIGAPATSPFGGSAFVGKSPAAAMQSISTTSTPGSSIFYAPHNGATISPVSPSSSLSSPSSSLVSPTALVAPHK